MSTSNRINKPGYESYQPVLAARQFGLCQTSPRLIIHENILSRAVLTTSLVANKAHSIFSEIQLQIPSDLEFTYTADDFSWWAYWKPHLFQGSIGSALSAIHPEHEVEPEEVISFGSYIISPFCSSSI
jgi:hypothetical protein